MNQTVGLVMIVKNEAPILGRLAASVRGLISHWVICDTGSTDGTIDVIEKEFAGIPGKLLRHRWFDYAANRTLSLRAGLGTADYLLLLDADQTIRIEGDLPDLTADAYELLIDESWAHWLPRLLRGDLEWRFEGSAHEYLVLDREYSSMRLPELVVEHHADGGGRPDKFQRERALLEKDLRKNPDNPRTLFYLAQTLVALGEGRNAAEIYRRRIELGGWEEEVFWSRYQRALLVAGWNRPAGITELLEAWEYRPTRAEPLYELTRIFREETKYSLAYLFGSEGRRIAYPKDDVLFVERWIYDWGVAFEWAVAAYWVGDYGGALEVNEQLLLRHDLPENYREATESNRDFCRKQLGIVALGGA